MNYIKSFKNYISEKFYTEDSVKADADFKARQSFTDLIKNYFGIGHNAQYGTTEPAKIYFVNPDTNDKLTYTIVDVVLIGEGKLFDVIFKSEDGDILTVPSTTTDVTSITPKEGYVLTPDSIGTLKSIVKF